MWMPHPCHLLWAWQGGNKLTYARLLPAHSIVSAKISPRSLTDTKSVRLISRTGQVYGLNGSMNSTTNFAAGVSGDEGATTGQVFGVFGSTASTSGTGVNGIASATTGNANGVYGQTSSPSGVGVFGFEFLQRQPTS